MGKHAKKNKDSQRAHGSGESSRAPAPGPFDDDKKKKKRKKRHPSTESRLSQESLLQYRESAVSSRAPTPDDDLKRRKNRDESKHADPQRHPETEPHQPKQPPRTPPSFPDDDELMTVDEEYWMEHHPLLKLRRGAGYLKAPKSKRKSKEKKDSATEEVVEVATFAKHSLEDDDTKEKKPKQKKHKRSVTMKEQQDFHIVKPEQSTVAVPEPPTDTEAEEDSKPNRAVSSYFKDMDSETEENPPPKKEHRDHRAKRPDHFWNIGHIYEGGGEGTDPSSISDISAETFIADEELASIFWGSGSDAIGSGGYGHHDTYQNQSAEEQGEDGENIPPSQMCESERFYQSMIPFIWFSNALGRLPFRIFFERRTKRLKCEDGCETTHILFTVGNLLLLGLFFLCGSSVMNILSTPSDPKNPDPYLLLEKLMFQKHWLTLTSFLLSLLFTAVGGLGLSLHRRRIVTYLNLFGEALLSLKYEGARSVMELGIVLVNAYIFTAATFLTLVIGNWLNVGESNAFITMLVVRWFKDLAYLGNEVHIVKYFVAVLQLYVFLSCWVLVTLILILTRGIRNVAHQWNIRIGLFLNRFVARPHQTILIEVKKKLTFKKMLRDHHIITNLIHKFSHCFSFFMLAYILTQFVMFVLFLYKIAWISFLEADQFSNLTKVQDTDIEYHRGTEDDSFELIFVFSVQMFPFYQFLQFIVKAGVTVMDGFDTIRRYGLVYAKNAKERKFIMSLNMSFCAAKPHIINPYKLFHIDRAMIGAIFMGACLIASIMIQVQIVSMVQVPIVLPCKGAPGKLCVSEVNLNVVVSDPEEEIDNAVSAVIELNLTTIPPVISSIPTPTTQGPNSTTTPPTPSTTTGTTPTPSTTPPPPVTCKKESRPHFLPDKSLATKAQILEHCGVLCQGGQIFHFLPKDINGKDLIPAAAALNNTWACLGFPYINIPLNTAWVYDCFGNCYDRTSKNEQQDCIKDEKEHQFFPFTISQTELMKKNGTLKPFTFNGNCYTHEDDLSPETIGDGTFLPAFPMLKCQAPWTLLDQVCSMSVTNRWDNEGEAKKIIQSGMNEKLLFEGNVQYGAHCIPVMTAGPQHGADYFDNLIKNEGDPDRRKYMETFNYTFQDGPGGSTINVQIHRLAPYTATGVNVTRIPIGGLFDKSASSQYAVNEDLDKLHRPYAFIHPKLFRSLNASTYGYFDCFTQKLKEHDDCGNLPFTIPVWQGTGWGVSTTPTKVRVPVDSRTFNCYPEFPGLNQKCGIPDWNQPQWNSSQQALIKKLVFMKCDAWRDYLNSNNHPK